MNESSRRLQIDRTLLTAPDQDRLSDAAGQRILDSLGARTVTMFLYSKRGLLLPVANVGESSKDAGTEAYEPGEDLVGYCASGGPTSGRFGEMMVTDKWLTETSDQFRALFGSILAPDTQIAYVPLNGPNRTYGVIRVIGGRTTDGNERPFSAEDRADLEVFAHQVALSLSSLRRKLELDVLAHVNKLLTDQPGDVGRVYDEVTRTLVDSSTEFAACAIRIRDRSGYLELKSLSPATGMNMVDKDRFPRRPDSGFLRAAFESKEPMIVLDVQSRLDEFHDPNWMRENGFVTAGYFPILHEEEIIGILSLYLWYAYEFYETKIEFLRNLCHQVATATRVVHLLNSRQQLIDRMSAIVSHSGSTTDLLQTILDGACALTGAAQGYLSMIDRREARLKPCVTTPDLAMQDIPQIDLGGSGLTALAVRTGKSVRRGDVSQDDMYIDFTGAAKGKTFSEVVVPLVHEQHVLGVLALQSDQRQYFSMSDQVLLEALAQNATLMFQRDRLYEATKTLANVDFSRASGDLESVIARSAAELVDADAAILRTYSRTTNELVLASHYPDSMNVEHVPTAMKRNEGACWDALEARDVVLFSNLTTSDHFHNHTFAITNGYHACPK